mmetsp:Transcript_9269/g.25217  ORF Transcript_9269/g.25217 Transcript_9269/m.25217 type:complete len:120 (+) Transcript_9269:81-440(+)
MRGQTDDKVMGAVRRVFPALQKAMKRASRLREGEFKQEREEMEEVIASKEREVEEIRRRGEEMEAKVKEMQARLKQEERKNTHLQERLNRAEAKIDEISTTPSTVCIHADSHMRSVAKR